MTTAREAAPSPPDRSNETPGLLPAHGFPTEWCLADEAIDTSGPASVSPPQTRPSGASKAPAGDRRFDGSLAAPSAEAV
jgi:hypothetical protein